MGRAASARYRGGKLRRRALSWDDVPRCDRSAVASEDSPGGIGPKRCRNRPAKEPISLLKLYCIIYAGHRLRNRLSRSIACLLALSEVTPVTPLRLILRLVSRALWLRRRVGRYWNAWFMDTLF